ncbi:MAG: hypothetical protein WBW81_06585 [Methylocella sp.]
MSTNLILIIAGAALFLLGLVKLARGQSGGIMLSNFGITFGGSTRQTNQASNVAPESAKSRKPDWLALGSAWLGFLTALVGLLRASLKD